MIPHRFGQSEPFTVGIEEELFCLDAETLAPVPFPREGLDGERLKEELFASVVELNTGIHADVEGAVAELARLRERAKAAASAAGLVLAGSGTWPTAGRPRELWNKVCSIIPAVPAGRDHQRVGLI